MKNRKKAVIITAAAAVVLVGAVAFGINRTTGKGLVAEPEINISGAVTEEDLKEAITEADAAEAGQSGMTAEASKQDREDAGTASAPRQDNGGSAGTGANTTQAASQDGAADTGNHAPATQPVSEGSNTPVQQSPASGTNIPPAQQPAGNEGSSQQPPAATTTEHTPVWHEPVYQDVWVVDVPAHTEEIPEYETRCRDVCNQCGADVTNNLSAHYDQLDSVCGGYHTEYYNVQIGTSTLNYPEEGHWEKVLVQEGYWE